MVRDNSEARAVNISALREIKKPIKSDEWCVKINRV